MLLAEEKALSSANLGLVAVRADGRSERRHAPSGPRQTLAGILLDEEMLAQDRAALQAARAAAEAGAQRALFGLASAARRARLLVWPALGLGAWVGFMVLLHAARFGW